MRITAQMNRELEHLCSGDDDLLAALYGPDGRTPREVAELQAGPWADVKLGYRLWLLWSVLSRENREGCNECLARILERRLPENCGARSQSVAEALRQDHVTFEITKALCMEQLATDLAYMAARAAHAHAEKDRTFFLHEVSIGASYMEYAASHSGSGHVKSYLEYAMAPYGDGGLEMLSQIKDILEFLETDRKEKNDLQN